MNDPPQNTGHGEEAASRTPRFDDSVKPRSLKLELSEQRLVIEWKDCSRSVYALDLLRRHCPCALCCDDRKRRRGSPLHVLTHDPTGLKCTGAQLVGSYAIQLRWSDGHKEGIFTFGFLRRLDEEVRRQDSES